MNENDGNGDDDDEEAADMEDFEESGMLEMVDPVSHFVPFLSSFNSFLKKKNSFHFVFPFAGNSHNTTIMRSIRIEFSK